MCTDEKTLEAAARIMGTPHAGEVYDSPRPLDAPLFLTSQKNIALFIVILLLCFLFLVLIAVAIVAYLWRRDSKKALVSAQQASKAADAAAASAEASAATNRELHAVLIRQQQQLQSAGIETEAVPLLPPGPTSDGRGAPVTAAAASAPVEGAQEWMATGDFVSNTFYEHYGTKRTVETAGIQLAEGEGGSSGRWGAMGQPLIPQPERSPREGGSPPPV